MPRYYVDDKASPEGDYEVHQERCARLPPVRTYLGDYATCFEAIGAAKRYYPKPIGCADCAPDGHATDAR